MLQSGIAKPLLPAQQRLAVLCHLTSAALCCPVGTVLWCVSCAALCCARELLQLLMLWLPAALSMWLVLWCAGLCWHGELVVVSCCW